MFAGTDARQSGSLSLSWPWISEVVDLETYHAEGLQIPLDCSVRVKREWFEAVWSVPDLWQLENRWVNEWRWTEQKLANWLFWTCTVFVAQKNKLVYLICKQTQDCCTALIWDKWSASTGFSRFACDELQWITGKYKILVQQIQSHFSSSTNSDSLSLSLP